MTRASIWLFIILVLPGIFFPSCRKSDGFGQEKFISIGSPVGGEVIIEGGPCTISWNSNGVSHVDIVLLKEGQLCKTIAERAENTRNFGWTVDHGHDCDSDYQIMISDSDDTSIYCVTRVPIKILPQFEKSFFVDDRDGREYRTVKIDDRWWMAENFRYETSEGSFYYNDLDSLGEIYGRLYTLEAARDNAPEGWHLPSDDEWKDLENFLGMKMEYLNLEGERSHFVGNLLKVGGGSGFNALYGGYYNPRHERCAHIYQEAHLWTSTFSYEGNAIIRVISMFDGDVIRLKSFFHSGCSVRYIKDK